MNSKPVIVLYTLIHSIRFSEVVEAVRNAAKEKRQVRLFAINIHNILMLQQYPVFSASIKKNDICFADGMPLVLLSALIGQPLVERVSGTDLTHVLLKEPLSAFLLGSHKNVLDQMKKNYSSIKGVYSPPFNQHFTKNENTKIVNKIRQSKAKMVYVALGSNRQERWVIEQSKRLPECSFVTVGSAFDILSGYVPRAPKWMQKNGLEWLWRILVDPKRLLKRYAQDICKLIKLFFIHGNPSSYEEIYKK
jgi:N-acetylglucosaminyldiphosphoundecaprenol N-acetyl-beta-D-mannosaminyltransferase